MTTPTTTEEFWSVIAADGEEIPLQTMAYNITTWGGDRQSVPPVRGSDTVIPWVPGQYENPRIADSRTLGLQMWVIGCTELGYSPPVNTPAHIQFVMNWRMLTRILYNKRKMYTLRKRFYDEQGVLRTADARVRFQDGLSLTMLSQKGGNFTCDLWLNDPFFYSDPITIPFDTSVADSWSGLILGQEDSRRIVIAGVADASLGVIDPIISISTDDPTQVLNLTASVNPGAPFVVDIVNQSLQVAGVEMGDQVVHMGLNDWLNLPTGRQTINFDQSSGTWSGTITYYPTWW